MRRMRSSVLCALMAISAGAAALLIFVVRIPPDSILTERSVLLSYPCSGPGALTYSLPRAGGNLSMELSGDFRVVVFEFHNFTRVWHKDSLSFKVPLPLMHFLSVGVLRNEVLRISILPATSCTETVVWPFAVEASAYLFTRAHGYSVNFIFGERLMHCALSGAGSGGLEVEPGVFEVCQEQLTEPMLGTAVAPWTWDVLAFFVVEAILTAGIFIYIVMNVNAVLEKWFVIYVLRVAPEFHLVRLTFLNHSDGQAADHVNGSEQSALTKSSRTVPRHKSTMQVSHARQIGSFWGEVLEGSHGEEQVMTCCTTYAAMRAFPCCACCCECCEEDHDRELASRAAAKHFLIHFLTDVVCVQEVCDFLISDPIQCDIHCCSAFLSACLHAVIGSIPHVPLLVAIAALGCKHPADSLPGDDAYKCTDDASWYEYALFGLITAQSVSCAHTHLSA